MSQRGVLIEKYLDLAFTSSELDINTKYSTQIALNTTVFLGSTVHRPMPLHFPLKKATLVKTKNTVCCDVLKSKYDKKNN